jgi:hypothetical protein
MSLKLLFKGSVMKARNFLKMSLLICLFHLQLYTAPQWNLIGLEEHNVNCLLFDYLLDGGSNLLAGADDGLYFYWPHDTNWIKFDDFPTLPVNGIKCAYRGRIVAGAGDYSVSWSDGAYVGDELLIGPPFYVFNLIDLFGCPQSLAVKGNDGDTVYVGGINNISMSVCVDSLYKPFEKVKTPPNCFGGNETAKCASLQLFDGEALVAGGYDKDTISPEQGHLLWQRAEDSMHVFGELNVSAMSLSESPLGELYIGTIDKGIYYYMGAMSSPPVKFVSSPNDESVNDLIVIPGEKKAEVILCVAVNSGVYVIKVKDDDTTCIKLADLPAPPNCVALLNRLTSDDVLYAGTSKGVYVFDTSNVPINSMPMQKDVIENLKIRNTKSRSILINFSIQKSNKVTLDVLDLAGRIIARPINAYFREGKHTLSWDVSSEYSNGLYIVRLSVGESKVYTKLVVYGK